MKSPQRRLQVSFQSRVTTCHQRGGLLYAARLPTLCATADLGVCKPAAAAAGSLLLAPAAVVRNAGGRWYPRVPFFGGWFVLVVVAPARRAPWLASSVAAAASVWRRRAAAARLLPPPSPSTLALVRCSFWSSRVGFFYFSKPRLDVKPPPLPLRPAPPRGTLPSPCRRTTCSVRRRHQRRRGRGCGH